jgi:hypothetical protein
VSANVTFSGVISQLDGPEGVTITITGTSSKTITLGCPSDGSFLVTAEINDGTYSAKARVEANGKYAAAESPAVYFTVGGGVLIPRTITLNVKVQAPFQAVVVVNPTSGSEGTVIAVNGAGFTANTMINVYGNSYDGSGDRGRICGAVANSIGQFASGFSVFGWSEQKFHIVASDGVISAETTFTVTSMSFLKRLTRKLTRK